MGCTESWPADLTHIITLTHIIYDSLLCKSKGKKKLGLPECLRSQSCPFFFTY